jgi:hypothetical protein
MILRSFIQNFIPSKEIKVRFNNKQIKINGKIINNLNKNINSNYYLSLEDWLLTHDNKFLNDFRNLRYLFDELSLGELFNITNTNVNKPIIKYLKSFYLLEIDKNNKIVLFKNND